MLDINYINLSNNVTYVVMIFICCPEKNTEIVLNLASTKCPILTRTPETGTVKFLCAGLKNTLAFLSKTRRPIPPFYACAWIQSASARFQQHHHGVYIGCQKVVTVHTFP